MKKAIRLIYLITLFWVAASVGLFQNGLEIPFTPQAIFFLSPIIALFIYLIFKNRITWIFFIIIGGLFSIIGLLEKILEIEANAGIKGRSDYPEILIKYIIGLILFLTLIYFIRPSVLERT